VQQMQSSSSRYPGVATVAVASVDGAETPFAYGAEVFRMTDFMVLVGLFIAGYLISSCFVRTY
jgi:hypothetical protein